MFCLEKQGEKAVCPKGLRARFRKTTRKCVPFSDFLIKFSKSSVKFSKDKTKNQVYNRNIKTEKNG